MFTPRLASALADALDALCKDDTGEEEAASEMRGAEEVIYEQKRDALYMKTTIHERNIVNATLELIENRIH